MYNTERSSRSLCPKEQSFRFKRSPNWILYYCPLNLQLWLLGSFHYCNAGLQYVIFLMTCTIIAEDAGSTIPRDSANCNILFVRFLSLNQHKFASLIYCYQDHQRSSKTDITTFNVAEITDLCFCFCCAVMTKGYSIATSQQAFCHLFP